MTHCPHRQACDAADSTAIEQPAAKCELISRLHADALVPAAICHACCDFPVPRLPELNPVVASHLYAQAATAPQPSDQSVEQRLSQLQLIEFCQSRLADAAAANTPANTPANAAANTPANANSSVAQISDGPAPTSWPASGRSPHADRHPARLRIGLIGWNSRFGLGHANRDLAKHLNVYRWLAPTVGRAGSTRLPRLCQTVSDQLSARQLARWLEDIDLVLFVEQPAFPALLEAARRRHTPVVCIPNWEWLTPGLPWLADVDLMLCPTRFTAALLEQWKARYGFAWQIEYLPWPIDMARFAFRQRHVCERFLYIGGRGGAWARDVMQPQRKVRRKGLELVLQAAAKMPHCQFLVLTTEHIQRVPSNVHIQGYLPTNAQLYAQGDVCLQPSYWEGTGLPLLECQAAGLPLITTDIAPLNEYDPWAVIPTRGQFLGTIEKGYTIPIPIIDVDDLTEVLGGLLGQSIAAASRRARQFVETHHAWSTARPRLLALFSKLVDCRAR